MSRQNSNCAKEVFEIHRLVFLENFIFLARHQYSFHTIGGDEADKYVCEGNRIYFDFTTSVEVCAHESHIFLKLFSRVRIKVDSFCVIANQFDDRLEGSLLCGL